MGLSVARTSIEGLQQSDICREPSRWRRDISHRVLLAKAHSEVTEERVKREG
jgi:hypothetical protein